jgi:TolB-like protein/class 3 adenylate cyclase/Tfp pilus assembly protein PilF
MADEEKPKLRLEIGHVLFLDIVGYSKLLIDEQSEALRQLNRIVRNTETARTAEASGQLIRLPTGDGAALVFTNSLEAPVECAIEIAKALRDQPGLGVRMGVHSGPVHQMADVNDRANIAGAGINIAQRVMDCGDAGHILLSKHVAEDLEQYGHWKPLLHDLGECEVKHGVRVHLFNLHTDDVGNSALPAKLQTRPAGPPPKKKFGRKSVLTLTAIFGVLLAAAAVFWFFAVESRAPAITNKSIAVLPFDSLSADPANAYFSEGVQDEILTRLSKIADLKVISRTSTEHYKSAPENLPAIAKQLGVAHILEGSVQKYGEAVRVNVQLIKAANDSHLWAETYDRKLTDIFSVESEIARAIADQLRLRLTGREAQVIAEKPTGNVRAYDAYLRGLAYTLKTAETPANALGAQQHLREAVRLDPKFALSWALLSYVETNGFLTLTLQPTNALREDARQAAENSLTLQPDLGEGIFAMGYFYYACLKDYDTAERYFNRARQFLPNSSKIPESLAYVARRRGAWDRSEALFNEAEQLDPRNVNLLSQHALSYACLRRFQQASRKLDQVLNITPDDPNTLANKASILQAEGDLSQAAGLLAPLHPTADDTTVLEVQIYQAVLERRPMALIPRLTEILAKPHPALGYYNGELRFWLGWVQSLSGDETAAQQTWREGRQLLENLLRDQPENFSLIGDLALINAALGDKAAALSLAQRAMTILPLEKDAMNGPQPIEIFARVAAQAGEADRAIDALQKLLAAPYSGPIAAGLPLTPALLRLDPMFDSLRNDPRFQKLCQPREIPGR